MARPHGTCDGLAWDAGCYCYHMSVGNLWLTCLRGKGNSVWFATLAASNLTQLPSHMNTAAMPSVQDRATRNFEPWPLPAKTARRSCRANSAAFFKLAFD